METILEKLIRESIICIYSKQGCTINMGEKDNGKSGVSFDREVIIKYGYPTNIHITPKFVDDFYFNWPLSDITIEQKVSTDKIEDRYNSDSSEILNQSYSRLYFDPPIKKIVKVSIMGFELSRLTEAKKLFNLNNKTTKNVLLVHGDNADHKVLLLPDFLNSIYVTNNIQEIDKIIKKRGLIVEKEIK